MFTLINRQVLAVALSLLLFSCKKEDTQQPTILPSDIKASVSYDANFENTIYPSLILSLNNFLVSQDTDFDLFTVNLTSPAPDAVLKVVLEESKFNSESVMTEELPEKGKTYSFFPKISWKFDELKNTSQPGSIALNFKIYINSEEVDRKILNLQYRSVNECVFAINQPGKTQALPFMFAAYVNEDSPLIDVLLGDVLEHNITPNFKGYQGDEVSVIFEVWSIWYHLQTKGVKYSSITSTSNTSSKILSQYVRFFSEVYNTNQANCVDGTVFLASILKKLGIDPVLVLEPGHMYLGFYAKPDKQSFWVLETTMIGDINLNNYVTDYDKMEASINNFGAALDINAEKYNSNMSKMADPNNLTYWSFDVSALRAFVSPINKRQQKGQDILERMKQIVLQ
jgi:hypothetical protein